jgi:UDP-N-acetylmuramoyl-tripeptide--D-alanyl-D-alanine ligase
LPEGGLAFLNFENQYIKQKNTDKKFISYGIANKNINYWAENIKYDSKGIRFMLCSYKNINIELSSRLLGQHNVLNIVAASAVALELGVDAKKVQYAVKQLIPIPHRLELKRQPDDLLIIDDAFNSNPEGAAEAINVLGSFNDYKKILVTPGMIELGEKEHELNFEFAKKAAGVADYIILVGVKRAKPMLEGLKYENYSLQNTYVAKNLNDGLDKLRSILVKKSIVLFENDLPDNYEGQ